MGVIVKTQHNDNTADGKTFSQRALIRIPWHFIYNIIKYIISKIVTMANYDPPYITNITDSNQLRLSGYTPIFHCFPVSYDG